MKKYFFAILLAVFTLTACNKEEKNGFYSISLIETDEYFASNLFLNLAITAKIDEVNKPLDGKVSMPLNNAKKVFEDACKAIENDADIKAIPMSPGTYVVLALRDKFVSNPNDNPVTYETKKIILK